ncbi:cytochrome P450 [Xylariaceae sp. FL0255]|nr:cytochrome P450 [Xylariaceae sp. FL0255]
MLDWEHSRLLWLFASSLFSLYWLLLRLSSLRRDGIPLRKPPNTLPLLGNGLLFLQERQKLFAWFVKCEQLFGHETFQITVPTLQPGVVVNDPVNLAYIFRNEGIFSKGDFVKRRSWDLFGNGIINADGQLWKVQRKAGLQFLNTANLSVLTNVALPRYLNQNIGYLKEKMKTGDIVDMQSVFHEITSKLMGKMAYGMEMHAGDEFSLSFDYASGITTKRFQNPLWFLTELITGARFRRSLATIKNFGLDIVRNAVQNNSQVPKDTATNGDQVGNVSGSLIKSLLESLGSDPSLVADAALNYLSAGRDTTAQALTWCLYLLMRDKMSIDRIRGEIELVSQGLENFGEDHAAMFAALTPTSLPFTMAVFYETIRLFPPVPFEIKECTAATSLPDGTFLSKGAIVLWSMWAMNRSRLQWGDDADSFNPSRWLTAEGGLITKSAAEFPVFNGGPRTCLGKRMAECVAVQVIAAMVLFFEFEPAYMGERVSRSSLTLPMKDGLPCYVKARHTSIENQSD